MSKVMFVLNLVLSYAMAINNDSLQLMLLLRMFSR